MHRRSLVATVGLVSALTIGVGSSLGALAASTPTNVDVSSQYPNGSAVNASKGTNESEEAIAVNPTNPNNIVMVTNTDMVGPGLFEGVSFDGGQTWSTRKLIGDNDNLGDACCDPSLAFDSFGNLFLSYLFIAETPVPIALSTDGGLHFNIIQEISKPTHTAGEKTATYRFTDQETITTGPANPASPYFKRGAQQAWVVFNAGGPIVATGALITGLGKVGTFRDTVVVPGTNNCTYGDVTIGPNGQVANVCTLTESGQGGGKLMVSVDPDGLGQAAGFSDSVFVADTHVGGFDFIPPQPDRSIDAEPGLAWDRSHSSHRGRLYIVYTLEVKNESDNTDIEVSYSDDQGVTWSAPVRVNDDNTVNSQFLPKIALDQTTGNLAVVWYDARNDLGTGGSGDTDGVRNTDAQFWGAFSTDGGGTFRPNFQISAGTSNSHDAHNGIDYGDYSGLAFYGGVAHPAWSDNSNSTGTNPDGALHELDVFSASVPSR
jgi:hypothetical protein